MIMDLVRSIVPPRIRRTMSRAIGHDRVGRPRRYIPAGIGIEPFFRALEAASVSYVVLRWFEPLPHVDPGEDIDMLVADVDLPKLAALLDNQSGSTPCDVYTAGGLRGTRYANAAYFPARLAERSLSRSVLHKGLYRVPDMQDHFDGLAYHAVYQKGGPSGLPTRYDALRTTAEPEHDYTAVLTRLAAALGLTVAIEMESLDDYLNGRGYRPDRAVLRALGKKNPWIKFHVLSQPTR